MTDEQHWPKRDGSRVICELRAGTRITKYNGWIIAVHPEEKPLIIHQDGTVEILEAPADVIAGMIEAGS